jgi:tetratricopeptide (TPR) repeat protein
MGGITKAFGALAVMAGLSAAPPTLAAETAAPAHAPCTGVDLAGDLSAVISACEALITSDKLKGDDLAEALRHLGDAYFRSFEIRTAYEIYQRALELKPDWPQGLWSFGKAAATLGDAELGIKSQRRAIELDPTYSKPHTSIGAVLSDMGDNEGALKEFDRALELDPKDNIARYFRALSYSDLGRKLDALHDLDALLADESAVSRTYLFPRGRVDEDFVGEIYRSRALIFRDIGSFDEALASLQSALDRRPGYANAAIVRSQLMRRSREYKPRYGEALAAIDRAISLHPDSPEIPELSMERARLLLAMDAEQEARTMLVDSVRLEPSAGASFFMGRSYAWEHLKEFDRARDDMMRAMSMDQWHFQENVKSMQEAGYLMNWSGLDPDVAMANAIIACVRDSFC